MVQEEETKDLIPAGSFPITDRDSKEIDTFTRTTDFLPQVRIYGSEATIVKEGKFPMGHFGLYFSPSNIIDLGEQFDSLIIDWRPRASLVSGDAPISFFGKFEDDKWTYSKEFTEISDNAKAKVQGYLAGLEYLVWIPSVKKYGLFLMGNPTLRRESANVKSRIKKAATLKIKLIKTAKFTWHGCTVFDCTTPFDVPESSELLEEVTKFRNPIDSAVEFEDSGGSSRAR